MFGRKSIFAGLFVAILLVAGIVADIQGADSRHMMNLQGRLTDTAGNPTSGDHLFELRVFNDATAGSQLYYEAQISTVNSGIYNILVGDGFANFSGTSPADYSVQGQTRTGGIPATVFDREDLWLEVEVDQDNPLKPRTKIVSSAFAYRALKADSLAGTPGGGGSAVNISGSTITDAGGGAVMGRGSATFGSTPLSPGATVAQTNVTKTTGPSKLRLTFSAAFARSAAGSIDCVWNIEVGAATVCQFTVGNQEDNNSGTFTSAAASNETTSTKSAENTGTGGSGVSYPGSTADDYNGTKELHGWRYDWRDDNPEVANHSHNISNGASGRTDDQVNRQSLWGGFQGWLASRSSFPRHSHSLNDSNYTGSDINRRSDIWDVWWSAKTMPLHSHQVSVTNSGGHTHSGGVSAHSHTMAHTHNTTLTIKDNWMRRVPLTRICEASGLGAAVYTVRVRAASGDARCSFEGGVLYADEVF